MEISPHFIFAHFALVVNRQIYDSGNSNVCVWGFLIKSMFIMIYPFIKYLVYKEKLRIDLHRGRFAKVER